MLSSPVKMQYIDCMKCENCGKEASVFYIFPSSDGSEERLCHNCVVSKAYIWNSMAQDSDNSALACPECSWTIMQFRASGKIGCTECIKTFKHSVDALKRRLLARKPYKGKRPEEKPAKGHDDILQNELKALNMAMKEAILKEDFEAAAIYRDKLFGKTGEYEF